MEINKAKEVYRLQKQLEQVDRQIPHFEKMMNGGAINMNIGNGHIYFDSKNVCKSISESVFKILKEERQHILKEIENL